MREGLNMLAREALGESAPDLVFGEVGIEITVKRLGEFWKLFSVGK